MIISPPATAGNSDTVSSIGPDPDELLRMRGLNRPSCRGGRCATGNLCDRCQAYAEWLRLEYAQLEEYAGDLHRLRGLIEAYPLEVLELLFSLATKYPREVLAFATPIVLAITKESRL